jgi:hypothetical protein
MSRLAVIFFCLLLFSGSCGKSNSGPSDQKLEAAKNSEAKAGEIAPGSIQSVSECKVTLELDTPSTATGVANGVRPRSDAKVKFIDDKGTLVERTIVNETGKNQFI